MRRNVGTPKAENEKRQRIDVNALNDPERMKRFEEKLQKTRREFKRKSAKSIKSAKKIILTC